MSPAQKRKARRKDRPFYVRGLTREEQKLFRQARRVRNLDQEIALMRLEIHRRIREQEPDPRFLQATLRLLIQAVVARHRLTNRQAENLGEAAAQLVEQFGAVFAMPGDEEGDGGPDRGPDQGPDQGGERRENHE